MDAEGGIWDRDRLVLNALQWPAQCVKPALIAVLRAKRQQEAEADRPSIRGNGDVHWSVVRSHLAQLEPSEATLLRRARDG
eukprot:2621456-Alexandrium_andersonii.AAC.1